MSGDMDEPPSLIVRMDADEIVELIRRAKQKKAAKIDY